MEVMNEGRPEGKEIYDDVFNVDVINAIFSMYMLSLGEF